MGYPLAPGPVAGGRPAGYWLRLFGLVHRRGPSGWTRVEWPDGRPLLAQPWHQVAAFGIISDEWAAMESQEAQPTRRQS
ncbi:MAG: hypothetical protein OEW12_05720 [Deltaproteobacteria bacterium]|nr:hypothetical protein [Deltaproteobacteria bacterium]